MVTFEDFGDAVFISVGDEYLTEVVFSYEVEQVGYASSVEFVEDIVQ